ncbi:MAG TPA: hypothetical protein VFH95_16140 [Candidatus Kapabacteria bacterium]|nr:hypothetical protein [Candidatus Kapabacteria bacterium]
MMPLTKRWLNKAAEDFRVMRREFRNTNPFLGAAMVALFFVSIFLPKCGAAVSHKKPIDKHFILAQARKKYYNLRNHGLRELHAQADVNWELMWKSASHVTLSPNEIKKSVKKYKAVHFDVMLDSDSNEVKVAHHFDHPFTDSISVNRTTAGIENDLSVCYNYLQHFTLDTLFPNEDSFYNVVDSCGDYWVYYQDDEAHSFVRMSKDFVIRESGSTAPTYSGSAVPKFEKSGEGFLLTNLDCTVVETGTPSKVTHTIFQYNYVAVSGLRLPHSTRLKADDGSGILEFVFSNYEIKK